MRVREKNVFRRGERALVVAVVLLACLSCCAQRAEEVKPAAASAQDFDVTFMNNEILVRRKGTDKWEHSRNVKETIKVELPDGTPAYLITKAIKPPKPKHTPDPNFPPEAKNEHNEGSVAMHVVVDDHGTVHSPIVYSSSGPEFTKAAIQAVQKWLFDPARLNEQEIPVLINIEMNFRFYGSLQK